MPNPYFKFKQFTIHQDKCAMKVTTDACLFGALVASSIFSVNKAHNNLQCLDIGTGTGLLSLMAAQKNTGIKIDAIEIDEPAAEQAMENIAASQWADNIKVFNADILSFAPAKKYDFIFSNPPFFKNNLKSEIKEKNNAKHDTSLDLLQVLQVADNYLAEDGHFAVLLPYQSVDEFIEEAGKTGLQLARQVLVKQTLKHKFFRGILFFSRTQRQPELSEIIIKDPEHNYTPEFATALKDYYLFL